MKRNYICVLCIFLFIGLIACSGKSKKDVTSIQFDTLRMAQTLHLDNDSAKPYVKFITNLTYVKGGVKPYVKDSINKAIIATTFGDEYQNMNMLQATDSFKQTYFKQFKDEVGPTYIQDMQENAEQTRKRWYNYTKTMKSNFIFNDADILSYRVDIDDNTGGAHGMHDTYFVNFNALTGKPFGLDDVFTGNYEPALNQLIMAELERKMKVKNQKDLEDMGFFASDSLAPTDNFYISDKAICFYYNVYEIAPYAVGALDVEVPFAAVRSMMNTDHNPLAELLE